MGATNHFVNETIKLLKKFNSRVSSRNDYVYSPLSSCDLPPLRLFSTWGNPSVPKSGKFGHNDNFVVETCGECDKYWFGVRKQNFRLINLLNTHEIDHFCKIKAFKKDIKI